MNDVNDSNQSAGSRLILFVHGSRDPRWREPFERMTAELKAEIGQESVSLVYMEFVGPTLMDAASEAAHDGVRRLRLLPLFLAGGAHVSRDIPEQVACVREAHPSLEIEVLPPIGEDPRFASLLREVAAEAAHGGAELVAPPHGSRHAIRKPLAGRPAPASQPVERPK